MAYRSIAPANLHEIPVGARVRFEYGPMHGREDGVVTGAREGRFGATLTALTDNGEPKAIQGITNIGIGVYLLDPMLSSQFLGE